MKKIVNFTLILFMLFICSDGFAGGIRLNESATYTDSNNNTYTFRYHYFTGFDFPGYKPSPLGLQDKLTNNTYGEALSINKNEMLYSSTDYFSLVSHSQGGLRALATSTYLKTAYASTYNKLQCVITISGIDKGAKLLEGGFGPLSRKVSEDINILYDGVRATVEVYPWSRTLNYLFNIYPSKETTKNFIMSMLPGEMKHYVKDALNGANPNDMAEIRDMFPNTIVKNTFIDTYVSRTVGINYKVIDHYEVTAVCDEAAAYTQNYSLCTFTATPVYKTVTAYEDFPKFGSELPIGYIVGLNSNTLSMADENEGSIRSKIKDARGAFDVAYKVHSVTTWVPIFGWVMNSSTNADRAYKARRWTDTVDDQMNEIKGENENDGLVAKQSQFYPTSFTDPKTQQVRYKHSNLLGIADLKETFVGYKEYNHKNIDPDKNNTIKAKMARLMFEAISARVRTTAPPPSPTYDPCAIYPWLCD